MKTNICIFTLAICLLPCLIMSEIKIKENAAAVFSLDNPARPAVYKIIAREFSKSDAEEKLTFLKSQGFSFTTKSDTGKIISYKNDSTGQILAYTPERSEYYYNNPKVEGFTDNNRADTNRMRSTADQFLLRILGDDGKNFLLNNTRLRYMGVRESNNGKPRLYQAEYNYVRILDGRLVKCLTSHIGIRLGQDFQLAHFQINDMKLEKMHYLDQKIKNSAMAKCLSNFIASKTYTETPDGKEMHIKTTIVKKGSESYIARQYGSGEYLEPSMSFVSIDTLPEGKTMEREFHLPINAAMVGNMSGDDKIEYEKHSKK